LPRQGAICLSYPAAERMLTGVNRRQGLAILTGLVMLGAGIVSEVTRQAQAQAADWVAHTQEVIGRVEATGTRLLAAESAERVFLLTSDERVLIDFGQARTEALQEARALRRLTSDNPVQQRQVEALEQIIQARFELLMHAVDLHRQGQRQAATDLVQSRGLEQARLIDSHLRGMQQHEQGLLEQRLAAARAARMFGTAASVLTTLVAFGLLAYLYRSWALHGRQMDAKAAEIAGTNRSLSQLAASLEERVAERTRELSDANAELEQFNRTVAHDLRAPARNIEAYAAALAGSASLPPEGATYAERLLSTSSRMQELITALLEYSRLAKAEIRLESVDLRRAVEQVLTELRPQIEAAGAKVVADPTFPRVVAHHAMLNSVLTNLVSNALKFVEPGRKPEIRIGAVRQSDEVVVRVEDRGIGVPAPDQERIFHPFTRLHGQETYPGTGVGLAIVRRAMERMGGAVRLRSAAGEGSVFELHLRAAE